MPTPSTRKSFVASLKFLLTSSLAILLAFSANAQLPGQLPVNLKTFKAMVETSNKVKIFWTTEYEKDNAYFNIEISTDGINFTNVGKVPGVNYHGHLTDYTFYDPHPLKGISYYRLKQVDVDGKFSYSPIERVKISDIDHSFDLFPNPVAGREFRIDVLKNVPGNIDLAVFDAGGSLRLQRQYAGNSIVTVTHNLPAGIYTVQITGTAFKASKKMIIQ